MRGLSCGLRSLVLGSGVAFAASAGALQAGCGARTFLDEPGGGGAAVDGGGGAGAGAGAGGQGSGGAAQTVTVTATTTVTTGTMQPDILEQLQAIAGMDVHEEASDYDGYRLFAGTFRQLVDHHNPNGQTFEQNIRILHYDATSPMVLANTGYMLFGDYLTEPAVLVHANQITVEQRYFEPSRPDPADWQFLNIEQAAADHHALVEVLKPLYQAAWLSTGASKGGMTSVYHRRFYPSDVDGTIAYVAPNSYSPLDERYVDFLDQVGSATCRDALEAFQVDALSRRGALVSFIQQSGGNYSYWDEDAALDFAVENLRFLIWQYADQSACANIPGPGAVDAEVYSYLAAYSPPGGVVDESILEFEPYYYQAATELGAPATDESYLAGLLTIPLGLGPDAFVLPGPTKDTTYHPGRMVDIQSWLSSEAGQMLFIYGQNDPWSATAFDPTGAFDSYRLWVPNGNHGSMIVDLGGSDEAIATDAVARWAGVVQVDASPEPTWVAIARTARLAETATNGAMKKRFLDRLHAVRSSQ